MSDELKHYGVLGMRWGRRKSRSSVTREAASQRNTARKEKKEAKNREKILSSPRKLYKNRDKFSQEEIDKAMKKMKWERELRSLSKAELSAGAETAQAILAYAAVAKTTYDVAKPVIKQVKKMW